MSVRGDDSAGDTGRPGLTAEDELAVSLARGRDELNGGRPAQAVGHLEDAVGLSRALGDEVGEAEAAGLLAQAWLRLDRLDDATHQARRGLELARSRGDEDAARSFEALLHVIRSSPEDRALNVAFGDGRAALTAGDLSRAAHHLGLARDLALRSGRRVVEAAAVQLLAQTRLEDGDPEAAAGLAEEARALAEELGDAEAARRASEVAERARASCPIDPGGDDLEQGKAALTAGELERGIATLERARDAARALGHAAREASASGLLAQAYFEVDRADDAIAHARRALDIAEALGEPDAAQSFRELLDVVSADPRRLALARQLQSGADALAAGDRAAATTALEAALDRARELAHEPSEATAAGLLARVYLELDRRPEAAALARRGLEIARARGEDAAVSVFEELLKKI